MIWRQPQRVRTFEGADIAQRRVRFRSQREQIRFLRKMVEQFRSHPDIRARARDIVFRIHRAPARDQLAQALAIAEWVQRHIGYVAELPETFQTPPTTIAEGYGDCDDMSSLVASLCEAIGIPTQLVGMEWKTRDPRSMAEVLSYLGIPTDWTGAEDFRHIFPRAWVAGVAVPLDASLPYPVGDFVDPQRLAQEAGTPVRLFIA